jgi:hypothetical protein
MLSNFMVQLKLKTYPVEQPNKRYPNESMLLQLKVLQYMYQLQRISCILLQ